MTHILFYFYLDLFFFSQKFGFKFQTLANKYGDWIDKQQNQRTSKDPIVVREGSIRLGSIEFGSNTQLCRSLEIKRLPTVHFYKKGDKIAGFPCGPKKFPLLQSTVEQYIQSNQQELQLEQTLADGDALMGSRDISSVLQDLVQQEATTSNNGGQGISSSGKKKKWWNILP